MAKKKSPLADLTEQEVMALAEIVTKNAEVVLNLRKIIFILESVIGDLIVNLEKYDMNYVIKFADGETKEVELRQLIEALVTGHGTMVKDLSAEDFEKLLESSKNKIF